MEQKKSKDKSRIFILKIRGENWMGLEVFEFDTKGRAMIEVSGPNEAGKSRVLSMVASLLSGGQPKKPVSTGEDRAVVEAELGDLVVGGKYYLKKIFKPGESPKLEIRPADDRKARYGSPQELLDELRGLVTMDISEFERLDPKKQGELLLASAGIQEDIRKIEEEELSLKETRKLNNRDIKTLEGQRAGFPHFDIVPGRVSLKELSEKLEAALREKQANDNVRESLPQATLHLQLATEQLSTAQEELKAAIKRVEVLKAQAQEAEATVTQRQKAVEGLKDPDIAAVRRDISEGEQQNARAEVYENFQKVHKQIKGTLEIGQGYENRLSQLRKDRTGLLEHADFPAPGLSYDSELGLLFKGEPLSQASSGAKIMPILALMAALHPSIRSVVIRDGTLLDEKNHQMLEDALNRFDLHAWVERKDETGQVGLFFTEGKLVKDNYKSPPVHKSTD